ncbi:hypothetical protein EB74_10245 [Mycobacterium sp. SWH-M5]|nr:hypothetical protein EB74_10245 [Mycobacterium sp. SWH-M5]
MGAIFCDDGADANGLASVSDQFLFDFTMRGVVSMAHLALGCVDIFTESITAGGNVLGEICQVFVC